ncbi:hypothetical protein WCLP8_3390004 [uncultured Gammaproteobacteria bacterium]
MAGRALTLAVVGRLVVPVIDRTLALTQAGLLGFDARAVALLLPAIEAGLWLAIGRVATSGVDDEGS